MRGYSRARDFSKPNSLFLSVSFQPNLNAMNFPTLLKLYVLGFGLILFSCNLDIEEDDTPAPPNRIPVIETIYLDNIRIREYGYNNNDVLLQINHFTNSGDFSSRDIFEYQGPITKVSNYDSNDMLTGYKQYSKIEEDTLLKERYSSDGNLISYTQYIYTQSDCSHTMLVQYDSNDEIISTTNIEYTNLICSSESTITIDGESRPYSKTTRDGERSYVSSALQQIRSTSLGNISAYSFYTDAGEEDEGRSYSASFDYNSFDQPSVEIRTYLDGDVEVYRFVYY